MEQAFATVSRPWDARLARRLILPLVETWVTPNHLTTVRLLVGLGSAAAFGHGGYLWTNLGALLLVLSNFLDHTDGELARLSGKTSRIGHFYDLTSDALIHVLLFIGIGIGLRDSGLGPWWAIALGAVAGTSVSLIFWLRMRIEERNGKNAARLPSIGAFEVEDVLYLMPLAALFGGMFQLLEVAAVGAPLFLLWVVFDYLRKPQRASASSTLDGNLQRS